MSESTKRVVIVILLIAIGVAFFTVGANKLTSPEFYDHSIEQLDGKMDNVLKMVGVTTATSTLLSFLPGDAANPLAENLADLSGYLLMVLSVIYLEKYLLVLFGFVISKALIPAACLLLIVGLFRKGELMGKLAAKCLMLSLVLFLLIPVSVVVSDAIESAFQYNAKVEEAIEAGENANGELQEVTDKIEEESTAATESKSRIDKAKEAIVSVADSIGNWFSDVAAHINPKVFIEKVQTEINKMFEAIAVMIVTSCVIPIVVLFILIWVIRVFFNVNISANFLNPAHWTKNKFVSNSIKDFRKRLDD